MASAKPTTTPTKVLETYRTAPQQAVRVNLLMNESRGSSFMWDS